MYPKPIKEFIEKFSRLPGIGPRQAARLAFWILNEPKIVRDNLKKALESLDKNIKTCSLCFYTIDSSIYLDDKEKEGCHFCNNSTRDHKTICVVEKETDLATIE